MYVFKSHIIRISILNCLKVNEQLVVRYKYLCLEISSCIDCLCCLRIICSGLLEIIYVYVMCVLKCQSMIYMSFIWNTYQRPLVQMFNSLCIDCWIVICLMINIFKRHKVHMYISRYHVVMDHYLNETDVIFVYLLKSHSICHNWNFHMTSILITI